MVKRFALGACIIMAGCNTVSEQKDRMVPARPVTSIVGDTVSGTFEGAWGAVKEPFEDLNLKRQAIPEKLAFVANDPYALPPQMLCEGLRKEIAELDKLLGPDICTLENPTGGVAGSRKGEYIEQGAGFAREQVVGIVRGKTNIIPFRGVVRKMSGAEKHARKVERAYEAGKMRRAFLKGIAAAIGPDCLKETPPTLINKGAIAGAN